MPEITMLTFSTSIPMPTKFWLDFIRYAKTIGADFDDGKLVLTAKQYQLLKIWWKENTNA